MIKELRQRLAKYPANRPSITARNALGSGEGQGGFAISANILGPDLNQLTNYIDDDGFPMAFQPGPTWVIFAPKGTKVSTSGGQ